MRIGIDTHFITSGQATGNRTYTAELVSALMAVDTNNEYVLYAEHEHPYYRQFKDNLRVRVRYVLPHNGVARNFFALPWVVAQDKLDVLHLQYILPWFVTASVVLAVHDLFYLHTVAPSFYEKVLAQLTVSGMRRAGHIVTLSEYSRQDIISRCSVSETRLTAIPLAAHPRFAPVRSIEQLSAVKERLGIQRDYLLYVGRTEDSRKNLITLVEAYAQIRQQAKTTAQLVIAGRHGPQTELIKQRVRDLGLESDVLLPGIVAGQDLPALLSGASVFVFVSSFEGFGLPVLEAMACGTPVITSNVTSLPEVAGDAALQISPGDVRELKDAIERLLSDESLCEDLRAQGLKRAALFSWERTARETVRIYDLLAGR